MTLEVVGKPVKKIRTIGAALDDDWIEKVLYLRELGYNDSVMVRRGLALLYERERREENTGEL